MLTCSCLLFIIRNDFDENNDDVNQIAEETAVSCKAVMEEMQEDGTSDAENLPPEDQKEMSAEDDVELQEADVNGQVSTTYSSIFHIY